MLSVLVLVAFEKAANLALAADPITQQGIAPLSGKTLRLVLQSPPVSVDLIFNDDHIRFEPVTTPIFEPRGGQASIAKPDCIVTARDIPQLLYLMGQPEGNLPIQGDYKILAQVKRLMAGFQPDFIDRLQPVIGVSFASQLTLLFEQLKGFAAQHFVPNTNHGTQAFAQNAVGSDFTAKDQAGDYDIHASDDTKQAQLRRRADEERERMRRSMLPLD